jgi:CRISPR/Cas system-associated exonuclease Cas4 (RecB family)
LVDRSDFFCTTNSDVNFAGTLLRDELGFKETRIIGFNLIGNYKKIYPALSDNKVESFKNATASICERINKEEYDYLASKAHCSSCQYLEFCKNLR